MFKNCYIFQIFVWGKIVRMILFCVVMSIFGVSMGAQLRYAKKEEYQYLSILVHGDNFHVCNGVLAKADRVVTATNCVLFPQFDEKKFEKRDLSKTSVDVNSHFILVHDPGSTKAIISEMKHHPKMAIVQQPKLMGNEATVLMLDREIAGVRPVTFASQNVKKLEDMYKNESEWPQDCEIVSFNLGAMTDEEVKAAGIDKLANRDFYKQALKVKIIHDDQCVKELCAFDKKLCGINLVSLGMFCVKAESARFNKTTYTLPLFNETYEMEYGSCRGIFGSPLICHKHLWGVGAYFQGQYCHTSNPPMLFIKANLLKEVAEESRKPIEKKSFAQRNYIPSAIFLLTISFLL